MSMGVTKKGLRLEAESWKLEGKDRIPSGF
jgi:hypothetical protein